MRKKTLAVLLTLSLCVSLTWSQGIRKAVYAGSWYEKTPEKLSRQIDFFLQNVKQEPLPSKSIVALIAPHAGHVFSGPVAAFSYSLVQGKDYETVVIIAPSHRYGFEGCSIYLKGGYETPLGVAKIDEILASQISKASGFKYIPEAHSEEHSVEIQLPFIQKTLPQAKIVPIVMGYQIKQTISTLSNALAKILPDKNVLVVASTDMSHQLPKKRANYIDTNTASLIKDFKTNTLIRKIERRENIMCGGGPVVSTLLYAQKRGDTKAHILHYADSSQYGSSENNVVGYLAAAIYTDVKAPEFSLTPEEKKELLHIAREAIKLLVLENKLLNYEPQNSKLLTKRGAFVTLKKRSRLRGCIGFIEPVMPLYQTVIQAALYAACRDQRFSPVTPEELKDLEIEISVLSPLKKIKNPRLVKVGKHGLVISMGDKKGLLLPQVPVENQWSRETFLQQACLKSGLRPDAWKRGAEIYIFEAIVFH
ncbi:MAG: AmmeMemoRadiSam system protein B [Candidatus Aminicenantes bacterium]|nr:MAG: AmmeMemoRadiSam system protein B [Candidatus Aminicenantes bacterium]